MKLRPYQEHAVSYAVDMLHERGNSLIVAGTGAGKTIMLAAAIGRFFNGFRAEYKRSPHILVLVHRNEIHIQNHSKFALVCPDIATSEITSTRKSLKGYVHFGMVQTVTNIMPELAKTNSYFDMIVIDEAHHAAASTYEDIINMNLRGNPQTALLGVTATPNRGDKLPLIHLFDNFYQITSRFLIDSHYLVRPKFIDLSPVFNLGDKEEKGHLAKNCKDDDAGQQIINKLCDDFIKFKEPGKSIIFAPSHEFCDKIYVRLKKLGRSPAYLGLGLDDTTRKAELERFENGDSDELINVDICTEGYDYPPLRNLVDFDTNGTHGQWVQKVGRVLRTCDGKTSCTVIDFGGNVELYPQGVETDVALEGAVKKERGNMLTVDDLFKETKERDDSKKATGSVLYQSNDSFTPYHLPHGMESINDKDYGIVFVSCGIDRDCIIVNYNENYSLFLGDKKSLRKQYVGEFDECARIGVEWVGDVSQTDREISNIQIKMLAPDYPTTALTWNGANCCICWKSWKAEVERGV
ncbi:MAG: DEAD/DEAH box helicase [Clostridia bacterium]|nr:DEAD/DEAH box helicase [Clostridia bacterium]